MSNNGRQLSDAELKRRKAMRLVQRGRAIRRRRKTMIGLVLVIIAILFLVQFVLRFFSSTEDDVTENQVSAILDEIIIDVDIVPEPDIDVQLLEINEYSRPGTAIDEVQNIVIHYIGNPGTTAEQNHSYYENLSLTHETSVSSNFIVGLEGEIIQCIPTDEVAYATGEANSTSLSIEVCHWDATGEFSDVTYESVVHLAAWLCEEFDLEAEDVIRHYDVTGKACPLYYVENQDAWDAFIEDVAAMLAGTLVY